MTGVGWGEGTTSVGRGRKDKKWRGKDAFWLRSEERREKAAKEMRKRYSKSEENIDEYTRKAVYKNAEESGPSEKAFRVACDSQEVRCIPYDPSLYLA
ncbi:hypothetical protein QQP08_017396 [Theobroma cacao]|nr:hypothetical protein QQP08_017396 [Theobroma cacao]